MATTLGMNKLRPDVFAMSSFGTKREGMRQVLHSVSGAATSTVATASTATSTSTGPRQTQSRSFTSLNQETPFRLCFLRHGQSTWNRDNRFIGWTDTPLTEDGVLEARVAGQMLYKSGIQFDEVHTSLLRRSIRTANIALMELGQEYIPVYKHWRLNERNYGDLVGRNKKEAVMEYGKDQVKQWRRGFHVPPPPMADDHPYHPARDPRYRELLDQIPKCESLRDTVERSSVYWDQVLAPALKQGKTLLVVGHENNLRSILMRLEGISEKDIINLSLPRAVPLAYRLDENLRPIGRPDGSLDEATGFLRGEWLGGDQAVSDILDRDHKQVYDTTITQNLEMGAERDSFHKWMGFVMGKASPEAAAAACHPATEPLDPNSNTKDDRPGSSGNTPVSTSSPSKAVFTTSTTKNTKGINHGEAHVAHERARFERVAASTARAAM